MREYCSVFTQCLFASMLIPAHQKHTATYTATRTSKQHNRYITWYHAVKGRRRQLSLFFIFGMAWICTDICIWLLCVVYHVQCSVCVCSCMHWHWHPVVWCVGNLLYCQCKDQKRGAARWFDRECASPRLCITNAMRSTDIWVFFVMFETQN